MPELIDAKCKLCGNKFRIFERILKYGRGIFCSKKCSMTYNNQHREPAESKTRLRGIAREIYMERNGNPSCSHCGKFPADVHHLNGNIKDNSRENLIPFCRSCHTTYHNIENGKKKTFTANLPLNI